MWYRTSQVTRTSILLLSSTHQHTVNVCTAVGRPSHVASPGTCSARASVSRPAPASEAPRRLSDPAARSTPPLQSCPDDEEEEEEGHMSVAILIIVVGCFFCCCWRHLVASIYHIYMYQVYHTSITYTPVTSWHGSIPHHTGRQNKNTRHRTRRGIVRHLSKFTSGLLGPFAQRLFFGLLCFLFFCNFVILYYFFASENDMCQVL